MCGPVLALVGTAVSAVSSIMQANAQAAALKAQSDYNNRQAIIEADSGIFSAQQLADKGKKFISAQLTGFTSNGISPNFGSSLEVAKDTATEIKMDVAAARYGAKIRTTNFQYQASIDRMNASATKSAGILGAVATGISGLTQLAPSFAVNINGGSYA